MGKNLGTNSKIVVEFNSPEETSEFARRLSGLVGAGDVLFLTGPVGAGKTLLARSLIQAKLEQAGLCEEVPSPTFTLVQTYSADALEICHADLYRIETECEIEELGLDEAFERSLCLVEWPEKLPEGLRQFTLRLDLAPSDNSENLRTATIEVVKTKLFRELLKSESIG